MGNRIIPIIITILIIFSSISFLIYSPILGSSVDESAIEPLTPDNNNSFNDAQWLFNNSKVSGTVNLLDDPYDYFRVWLRRIGRNGDLLNIKITAPTILEGVSVSLFNPEKFKIGDDVCINPIFNPITRSIYACYPSFYYIRIEAIPFSQSASYEIEVNYSLKQMQIDKDNTNITANTAVNGGKYSSTLEPVKDYLDLYNITLNNSGDTTEGLEVELFHKNGKYLAVYNPDGSLRKESDLLTFDDGDKEIVKFAADQTGVHRIAVGISGAPTGQISYLLNTTIVPGVPTDSDYDEDHATRVYDGTKLETGFDSAFDEYDFYVMELNQSDNLTVSILYKNKGPGDLDIEIYELGEASINNYLFYNDNKGVYTWAVAEKDQTDYYIKVTNNNLSLLVDYSILFSLSGENLWFQPMMKNNTNKDFSMLEDTIDITHVNLSHIFYDPDTEITLDSPSHPLGVGSNIDMEIMNNNTVKFMPHPDFFGSEVFNFSATDIDLNTLYWEVNVTVLPVNDPPVIGIVPDQEWDQDEVVNISLSITDVDDTEFTFYDNTDLFDINPLFYGFNFTPTNSQVGEYQININVSDGKINGSITFNATIMNINDPPLIEKVNEEAVVPDGFLQLSAEEDTLNYYTVFATDIDHDIGIMDVLEFTTNVSDSSFSIDSKTGNISFFPLQEHVGIFYVTIIVSDGNGGSDEQKVNFTVQNINDPPEFLGMGATVTNLTVDCSIYGAYDEDGDPLNYTWSFDDGTNTTTTEPNCDHEYSNPGIYNISVMVSDGNGGITIGNVFVNIETQDPGNGTNGTGNGTNGNGNGNGSKVFVDLDNDDLNDSWEEYYFGNLSQGRNEDFDKDGYSNYEEYLAGTDPTKNTDRPFDKKDDSKGDGDKDSGETLPLLYLVGIIGLVNLILIIIIILFIFMRKKQPGKAQPMDARVRGRHGAERKISCTYCGEPVFEHTRECPNCGEEFDLDFEGYDEEYSDSEYPEDGQTARGGRGRDEYPDWDKDYDYEREETEMEYDDEDYLEEDVEEYDEDYDEEELDEDYEDYEDEDYEETETTEWDDEDSEEYEEDYDEDYEEEYDDEDYEE